MEFREAFRIAPKTSVAIVGAGGKTTLLYLLARELAPEAARGHGSVLITTTTKIFRPTEEEAESVVLADRLEEARKRIRRAAKKDFRIVLATGAHADPRYERDKLDGIPPDWAASLLEMEEVGWLLVEADGSQRKPLKAPGDGEPVWPVPTHLAVAVLGLSAWGRPLNRDWVFRPEIAASVAGSRPGDPVDGKTYARLLLRPGGILRGCPPGARVIGFLNQADAINQVVPSSEIDYILKNEPCMRLDAVFAGSFHTREFRLICERG